VDRSEGAVHEGIAANAKRHNIIIIIIILITTASLYATTSPGDGAGFN